MTENLGNKNEESLEIGALINKQYSTVKKIGEGGFGIVWQAYDFSLRNFIAIKELLPKYAEAKFIEMFYKEALIAKNIIHDNIVRVQHFWQGSNGSYYVVMDYVRGIDLETLIKKCNEQNIIIPWKLSALICMNTLKAIDYANRIARDSITGNSYGIVYRDISPGNVLLSFDGNVKLSDFGIAKTADEIKDSIPEKVITGKYPYMSPEQIKGLPNIDHRTDIFSTGVLFYEMLTGKQLYSGTNEEIKSKVLNQKFDPATITDPTIPSEIGDIIAKSLEKDRSVRYERAIEMYRDIRRVLRGVETDELVVELSEFILKVAKDSVEKSERLIENVKMLDIGEIERNPNVAKVQCNDFIVGHQNMDVTPSNDSSVNATPVQQNNNQVVNNANIQYQQPIQQPRNEVKQNIGVEAKGKTVFEEVGDWLFKKFDNIKKDVVRLIIALIIAVIIFACLDVFVFQFTSIGKDAYAKLYPPDVVITTIPAGAVVSMKTRDGNVVLNNVQSNAPIPIRKVSPGSYIVTALKEGFKPVQRVVQIEKSDKSRKVRKEKIEIMFDFLLNVDSNPRGANVYIDGNKFGETPCKVQLLAGPHTIRLAMDGFEDLGSNAKETRAGQCDIDFSKVQLEEMFAGVDKKFWRCELKNIDSENIFSVHGDLFRKINIDSDPKGMMIHVHGESQPRGETPLVALFKVGDYKIRLLDPNAKYGEVVKDFKVTNNSKTDMFVKMNKIISFKVKSKDNPNDVFLTTVKIYNDNFSVTKEISSSKPVRIALPVDFYNVLFYGDNEYKNLLLKDVDVSKITSVLGSLEYLNVDLNIIIKDDSANTPLPNAYIWLNNKIIGKTNEKGAFKTKLKPGNYEFKFVASDFEDKITKITVVSGKSNTSEIVMNHVVETESEEAEEVNNNVNEDIQKEAVTDNKEAETNTVKEDKPKKRKATKADFIEEESKNKESDNEQEIEQQQVVVCLNCGYVNTAPKNKKLRFCVNCAKTLR